jgi:hypothetical protein
MKFKGDVFNDVNVKRTIYRKFKKVES